MSSSLTISAVHFPGNASLIPMQPHFKGEAKTASHPLTCPDSRKWSASLLLGYVWSWLLPMGGVVSEHPRMYKFVFFSAYFLAHCPGQFALKTTRNHVLGALFWTGLRSLLLYFQHFLQSSPQPEGVCLPNPHPSPAGCQVPELAVTPHTATPHPAAPSLPLSATKT